MCLMLLCLRAMAPDGTIRVVLISSSAINLEKSDGSIRGVLMSSNAKNREKFPL